MRHINSRISIVVSVVLISICVSEALASQPSDKAGAGDQKQTQAHSDGWAGRGSRGSALQLQMQMQKENQLKQPAHLESQNLRGPDANPHSNNLTKNTNLVVERDLNQHDMVASKSEVSIETRETATTSKRRPLSFLPEVEDQVLLRERGQPHKQPPTNRGPHKQPPTGRGPHRI